MKPSNLTTLDFNEIRESIKSYMRTRPEFSDYDFSGSTLSYLLDVLAYNTYYTSFNANMALNELFLDTATIRDNVSSLARMLNYVPRSAKASWGCVTLEVQTEFNQTQAYPGTVTIKKGTVAGGNNGRQNFTFSITQDKTVEVDKTTGIATIGPFKVYEGDLLSYTYTVDTTTNQKFIIPNDWVDIDTLQVYVKQNAQSTTVDKYNLVKNITNIDSTSRAYFISEYEDRRYEVTFGDGIVGKALEDGNIVIFEYIRTNGPEGNNISTMAFNGSIIDSDNRVISPSRVRLELNQKTQLGDKPETLKSIKFNAPRYYAAQNRAVTTKDYENIVKSIYPNAKYVLATGGETLSPPVYGKIYISVKTKNNTRLNNLSKKQIIEDLKPYSMASIEVVVQDPEEIFVELNVLVVADTFKSALSTATSSSQALPEGTADIIKEKALNAIKRFGALEDLGNFNKTLSTSKIQKEILQADKSIVDVMLQVSVFKLLGYPSDEQKGFPTTWDVNYGIELDCSCSSSPGDVIKSSGFYTADRPSTLQYLEDDGVGNLRQYYISNNKKVYTNNNAGLYDCATGIVRVGPISPVGEVNYIQLSIKPKNPANIAPGEVSGKLIAKSLLTPGKVISSDPNMTEVLSTSSGIVSSQTTVTVSASQTSGAVTIDGVVVAGDGTGTGAAGGSVTIGGVTTSGGTTGSLGTTSTSAATTGGTTTPSSTTSTTSAVTSLTGSTTIASSAAIATPGAAGSPGTLISLTPPTITVVPPGSATVAAFAPGGTAAAPATAITSTPQVVSYPALTQADSTSVDTCFA